MLCIYLYIYIYKHVEHLYIVSYVYVYNIYIIYVRYYPFNSNEDQLVKKNQDTRMYGIEDFYRISDQGQQSFGMLMH
jgi:hypothetical protein